MATCADWIGGSYRCPRTGAAGTAEPDWVPSRGRWSSSAQAGCYCGQSVRDRDVGLKWYDCRYGDPPGGDERPMKALAEAIWNSLDVGADHVTVDFEFTELEALKTIIVVDDGEGMNLETARTGFDEYGDSWKSRIEARTHNGVRSTGSAAKAATTSSTWASRPSGRRWPSKLMEVSVSSRLTSRKPTRGCTATRDRPRTTARPARRCGWRTSRSRLTAN
ncbi:MAG: hypothetical protein QOF31_585 [Mycobacterium sp.]|nr:hypothetical protein [Mycobacterium sp.]